MSDTLLKIQGIPFSDRVALGLTEKLSPIQEASQMLETIDGELDDLSLVQFRKYQVDISCSLFDLPALDGIWPGKEVVIDCVTELNYEEPTGGEGTPGEGANREIVPGSVRVQNGFVFYRPRLTCLLVSFDSSKDEYGATVSWTLKFREKKNPNA
jgi:hypothetical protein